MGNLSKAYITGDFAIGKNSKLIDLIIVGKNLNYEYLGKLIRKAEEITSLKIKYITINPDEENEYVSNKEDVLLIWSADK